MGSRALAVFITVGVLCLSGLAADSDANRDPLQLRVGQSGATNAEPECGDGATWAEQQCRVEKAHFHAAVALWHQKRYEDAVAEYEKAYRATRSPAHMYNMARGYSRLNKHREAAEYYRRFLDETKPGLELEIHLDYSDLRLRAAKYLDEALAQMPPPLHKKKWFRGVTIAGAILAAAAVVSIGSYYGTQPSPPEQVRFP